MSPAKKPSLKDTFVSDIEHDILSGVLEIGAQLPSERELAQAHKISRTVVRSGIAELVGKGFLSITPRIGAFVADYSKSDTSDVLFSLMNFEGRKLSREETRSIMETHMALMRLTLQLVIENVADVGLAELEPIISSLEHSSAPQLAANQYFSFHYRLCLLSGNSILPLLYASFKKPVCGLWERFCAKYGSQSLYSNANTLYELIKLRDLNSAVKWNDDYVRQSISGSREFY